MLAMFDCYLKRGVVMKKSSKVFRVIGIISAVALLLLIIVNFALGFVVKTVATNLGSAMLKTEVAMESCSLTPWNGRIVMKGFSIANPEGYSQDKLIAFDELIFMISIPSLLKKTEPILINEIRIRNPQLAYETKLGKPSNFDALKKTLEGDASKGKAPETTAETKQSSEGRKVIIDRFEMAKGKVSYRASLLGNQALVLPLPTIRLAGVGRSSSGVTVVEAISEVLFSITRGVVSAVADAGTSLGDGAKDAKNAVKDALKKLF